MSHPAQASPAKTAAPGRCKSMEAQGVCTQWYSSSTTPTCPCFHATTSRCLQAALDPQVDTSQAAISHPPVLTITPTTTPPHHPRGDPGTPSTHPHLAVKPWPWSNWHPRHTHSRHIPTVLIMPVTLTPPPAAHTLPASISHTNPQP
jgi:hypothetical protein